LLAASYGIRNPDGRELSPFNQCLLVHQNSSVSIVGGFQQWKKLGRSVKKGERSLAIWVPCGKQVENAGEAGANPDTDNDRFFILGSVFDITQTETDDEGLHHAPTANTRQAAVMTTATSEAGRKIFQPRRIN
jgi:hypothetical protein